MARAFCTDVLVDKSGNVVQGATVTFYTDAAATTLVTDAYAAASGGSTITSTTTDASGRWSVYFTTPQSFWPKYSDTSHTAHYPGESNGHPFTAFVGAQHDAFQPPADEVNDDNPNYRGFVNAADYGMSYTSSDNTAALQAAVDAAYTLSASVMIPPIPSTASPPYYRFTGSVDLSGKSSHIYGGGGRRGLGFATPPSVELANVTDNTPIFTCSGTDGFKFENLALYGRALECTSMRRVDFTNCSLLGQMIIENSFWWTFHNCGLTGTSTSAPPIILRGNTATFDENISYLFEWHNCTFSYAGVRYEQYVNYAPNSNPGNFLFVGCDSENLASGSADGALLSLLRTGTMTDTLTVERIIVDGFEHYDTSGSTSVPLVSCPTGTSVQAVQARNIKVFGEVIRTETAPVGITVMENLSGSSVARTAAGAAINQLSTEERNGEWLYRGSTGTPTLYGFAARYGTDTVRRWGVRADGQHEWGPGNAAVDVNLYRSAADTLKTDDSLVVGTNLTVSGGTVSVGDTGVSRSASNTLKTNGTFVVGATGSAGSPALQFAADADSGFYQTADNNIAVATGGTQRVTYGTSGMVLADSYNVFLNTTNGTKIGTATNQKLGFWNATPIVQPTTAGAAATLVGGGGTALTDTDTFDGYTLKQIVKALRNAGLLA